MMLRIFTILTTVLVLLFISLSFAETQYYFWETLLIGAIVISGYSTLVAIDWKYATLKRLRFLNYLFFLVYLLSFCSLFLQWNFVSYAIPLYGFYVFLGNSSVMYILKKVNLNFQYESLLPNIYLGAIMLVFPFVLGLCIIAYHNLQNL